MQCTENKKHSLPLADSLNFVKAVRIDISNNDVSNDNVKGDSFVAMNLQKLSPESAASLVFTELYGEFPLIV